MNFSIALPAMAPQSTGHPASLPADPTVPDSTRKVTPTRDSETSARTGSREQQETAPPSTMQIKIMEIRGQQARELEEEAASR